MVNVESQYQPLLRVRGMENMQTIRRLFAGLTGVLLVLAFVIYSIILSTNYCCLAYLNNCLYNAMTNCGKKGLAG